MRRRRHRGVISSEAGAADASSRGCVAEMEALSDIVLTEVHNVKRAARVLRLYAPASTPSTWDAGGFLNQVAAWTLRPHAVPWDHVQTGKVPPAECMRTQSKGFRPAPVPKEGRACGTLRVPERRLVTSGPLYLAPRTVPRPGRCEIRDVNLRRGQGQISAGRFGIPCHTRPWPFARPRGSRPFVFGCGRSSRPFCPRQK